MPGLVPGIHVFLPRFAKKVVDGRDKPGHDIDCGVETRASIAIDQ
jgi:hypothetical protein